MKLGDGMKNENTLLKIILTLLLIVIFVALFINKESTIKYDHSKKEINKEALIKYEDNNDCKINKELDGSAKDYDYKKVFNKNKIQDVYIDVPETNLFYLFENAIDKPQVYINNIKIGDYNLSCSSMKPKGYTTLRSLWHTKFNKFSFTINFKKYLKDQNLFGLTKISFNNMYADPSMSKEFISYYLFNEMGLDTPDYSYVNLYINNDYYGVYFMIEPIEKSLTKRTMNEKEDFLFKPEGEESSLIYNEELDNYLEDGTYNFDSLVHENGKYNYPRNSNNLLNKYRGIWEDDPESFEGIYNDLPTFFKTIKKLTYLNNLENKNTDYFEEELESIIDVDKLIKYNAINTYLVNTDGYMNSPPRNYALYMNKDGFLTIIPWDYNTIFGATILDNSEDVVNFNIYNPVIDCNIEDRPLLNVILDNDNYRNKYNEYLKDIIKIVEGGTTSNNKKYPKNNINNLIDKNSKEVIKKNNKCKQKFYDEDEIKTAKTNLKKIIKARSKAVLNQIEGKEDRVSTDVDLNTLGSLLLK